jgi:hypothetical protein
MHVHAVAQDTWKAFTRTLASQHAYTSMYTNAHVHECVNAHTGHAHIEYTRVRKRTGKYIYTCAHTLARTHTHSVIYLRFVGVVYVQLY